MVQVRQWQHGKELEEDIRKETRFAYHGIPSTKGPGSMFVARYCDMKMLTELGYRFNGDQVTTFDVFSFRIINEELNKLRKRASKSHGKRH